MRYPIFSFDGDDLWVFDSLDDTWKNLEVYDIAYPEILLDSDGRLLTKSDAGNDRVSLSDSGAEPDPERLRSMLIHALRKGGRSGATTPRWRPSYAWHKRRGIRELAT